MQEIGKLTKQIDCILPTHIRRKGNVASDNLENWGSSQVGRIVDVNEEELHQMEEMESLVKVLEKDKEGEGIY